MALNTSVAEAEEMALDACPVRPCRFSRVAQRCSVRRLYPKRVAQQAVRHMTPKVSSARVRLVLCVFRVSGAADMAGERVEPARGRGCARQARDVLRSRWLQVDSTLVCCCSVPLTTRPRRRTFPGIGAPGCVGKPPSAIDTRGRCRCAGVFQSSSLRTSAARADAIAARRWRRCSRRRLPFARPEDSETRAGARGGQTNPLRYSTGLPQLAVELRRRRV